MTENEFLQLQGSVTALRCLVSQLVTVTAGRCDNPQAAVEAMTAEITREVEFALPNPSRRERQMVAHATQELASIQAVALRAIDKAGKPKAN